ncbi:hypothetical protein E3E14_12270 [Streptomyces sp. ICN441]|uniref:DUF892 domain-containing protein n=1 Tax=Streptomyces tirandamycinicus TaxID=2174846 RepID=A0A2S1T127_9ACTN|nr:MULTISPECIES: hypothetical protein [Streptomyces]AWI32362.1 hypothetical protein DDW44_28865 [Streptomyces tirandamycinicus]TFE51844.1 hypothetical protein E3E14_12270 [Streptomyces sp. ICN441]
MHRDALRIYLNDHLSGATSGVELARRIARTHRSSPRASELRRLADDIAEDREALRELMGILGIPPHRYKIYSGWAMEKAARLKPNGRVLRRAGLSTILELEALRMGIQGKYMLWRALTPVARLTEGISTARLDELLDRAESQLATVEDLHLTAAETVLSREGS